jgi:hypothetical protein
MAKLKILIVKLTMQEEYASPATLDIFTIRSKEHVSP